MLPQDYEQWHWQEPGKAWKGVGIYHVTLTVPTREPLLGRLVIPEDDPIQARIERTEMGNALVNKLLNHPSYYPEIRILQFCLMPDHLHAILHVTRPMEKTFNTVVRSLWQGAKKLGRAYSSSISPESDSGVTNEDDKAPFSIFTEHPFIRPLSRRGQLQTMIRYVMNPQRLATKHLMPDYFRVQDHIEIAGRIYSGVGNADLLQRTKYMPVHVRSTMIDEAIHGDDRRLKAYMDSCIEAAQKGIHEKEREVLYSVLADGGKVIYLADNGFGEYYKPSDGIFDAVAHKQVLILSPWSYDPKKKGVTRAECVAMNKMAEEICTSFINPESDSGLTNEDKH